MKHWLCQGCDRFVFVGEVVPEFCVGCKESVSWKSVDMNLTLVNLVDPLPDFGIVH